MQLSRIGLYRRDHEQDYRIEQLQKLFARSHIELLLDADQRDPGDLDMVISMGGDGTVLRALAAYPGVPVLAVNFGNVGFLTQADQQDLDRFLVRLLADDFKVEERLTLAVRYGDVAHRAINEVVLKGTTNMISVGMSIDGRLVHTARGDGVIVGTPTGSTAYLLSTGAPVVVPEADVIIVKPFNEYSFSSRTVIVAGSSRVTLTLGRERETDVGFTIDGQDRVPMQDGETLEIERSAVPARLVYFDEDYFFRNLKDRLRW